MEIVNYHDVADPKVIAKFDLYLGPTSGITYPNFKVFRNKTGGWYAKRPSYVKSEDGQGNKVWGNYPEMSEEKWKSLSAQLHELLKPLVNDNPPF